MGKVEVPAKPNTREEAYLAAIAGQAVEVPAVPITREEAYLDAILKNGSGGGGGTTDYTQLENKPQINDVTLTGNKSLSDLGVASASAVSGKADKVTNATANNFAKLDSTGNLADSGYSASSFLADVHFDQTVTLSTSASTTATFTNAAILSTSLIDVAVSEWGLVPEDVTVSAGTCTVTLPKVDSAHSVTVRIYVR